MKENESKSKTKNIQYKELKLQNYLKSKLFSNYEVEYLFRLRSETVDLKSNFKTKYNNKLKCSINECSLDESQQHIFNCQHLIQNLTEKERLTKYSDIYSTVRKQYQATRKFIKLMNKREKLIKSS